MGRIYRAADVAACIIETAISAGRPVSNLQLQKLLFFCQCRYLEKYGHPLFSDEIVAWQYGPVVKDVYRTYSYRGASPIKRTIRSLSMGIRTPFAQLEGAALQTVREMTRKWLDRDPWDLVRQSHRVGGAWDMVYNRNGSAGSGYDDVIGIDLMRLETTA